MELLAYVTGKNSFTVRNSREFAELVRKQFLGENDVLVSYDAVSLFTNTSKALALEVAGAQLNEDCSLESRRTLTIDFIMLMLRFCQHNAN